MSWPATDWADNVAWHALEFTSGGEAFSQTLRLPGDPEPKPQSGYAVALPVEQIDLDAPWTAQRERFGDVFDALAMRYGSASA